MSEIAFTIAWGPPRNRRYVKQVGIGEPLVWTRDIAQADKWGTIAEANAFGEERLIPESYRVVMVPITRIPGTDRPGGTPVAMAA